MTHRTKAYAYMAIVFALGAVAGAAASFAYAQQSQVDVLSADRHGAYEDRKLRALTRKLDLDAEQRERVGAILARSREELHVLGRAMVEQCGQPVRDHRARVDAEIREVLHPDQQQRYDQLIEERREHFWLAPNGAGQGH